MEFWSTGVLLDKLALQYSITPIKDLYILSIKNLIQILVKIQTD